MAPRSKRSLVGVECLAGEVSPFEVYRVKIAGAGPGWACPLDTTVAWVMCVLARHSGLAARCSSQLAGGIMGNSLDTDGTSRAQLPAGRLSVTPTSVHTTAVCQVHRNKHD